MPRQQGQLRAPLGLGREGLAVCSGFAAYSHGFAATGPSSAPPQGEEDSGSRAAHSCWATSYFVFQIQDAGTEIK